MVGKASTIASGEYIEAVSVWKNDLQYGLQLSTVSLTSMPPTTIDGIKKHLSSGFIKGVGAVYGERLVKFFGTEVFNVIETAPLNYKM